MKKLFSILSIVCVFAFCSCEVAGDVDLSDFMQTTDAIQVDDVTTDPPLTCPDCEDVPESDPNEPGCDGCVDDFMQGTD